MYMLQEYLNDHEHVDFDTFEEKVWNHMKDIYNQSSDQPKEEEKKEWIEGKEEKTEQVCWITGDVRCFVINIEGLLYVDDSSGINLVRNTCIYRFYDLACWLEIWMNVQLHFAKEGVFYGNLEINACNGSGLVVDRVSVI